MPSSVAASPGLLVLLAAANVAAGSYRIVCDQPGHEQAGMKGTLTAS